MHLENREPGTGGRRRTEWWQGTRARDKHSRVLPQARWVGGRPWAADTPVQRLALAAVDHGSKTVREEAGGVSGCHNPRDS